MWVVAYALIHDRKSNTTGQKCQHLWSLLHRTFFTNHSRYPRFDAHSGLKTYSSHHLTQLAQLFFTTLDDSNKTALRWRSAWVTSLVSWQSSWSRVWLTADWVINDKYIGYMQKCKWANNCVDGHLKKTCFYFQSMLAAKFEWTLQNGPKGPGVFRDYILPSTQSRYIYLPIYIWIFYEPLCTYVRKSAHASLINILW